MSETNKQEDAKNILRDAMMEKLMEIDPNLQKLTIEWREGEANPIPDPKSLRLVGEISAPARYLKNREPNLHDALVSIDRAKMQITYYENPESELSPIITGELKPNPKIEAFKINTGHEFMLGDFIKLIQFNKGLFMDREAAKKLEFNLRNLKSKISTEINNADDKRGNTIASIERKVQSEIDLSFQMVAPLFRADNNPLDFWVNICLSPKADTINIYLESDDLISLMEAEAQRRINEVREELLLKNLTVIEI